jgi:hypothetical protein
MTIRAVRNNNPGNLDAGEAWQGLMPRAEMTPELAAETRFAVFKDAHWGFRALAIVLLNYEKLHGLNTVRGIINRWAPAVENNTSSYVAAVSHDMGVHPDDPIELKQPIVLDRLCKAIATHECGSWMFSDQDLKHGIAKVET